MKKPRVSGNRQFRMSMDFSISPLKTSWPDFYALLEVTPDASPDELRARIRTAYVEAAVNSDHRNVARRDYYTALAHRVIPQARRILLEETTRQLYDQQLALHRHGDSNALPYELFVAQLAQSEDDAPRSNNTEDALPTLHSPDNYSLPISSPPTSSLPTSSPSSTSATPKALEQTATPKSKLFAPRADAIAANRDETASSQAENAPANAPMDALPSLDQSVFPDALSPLADTISPLSKVAAAAANPLANPPTSSTRSARQPAPFVAPTTDATAPTVNATAPIPHEASNAPDKVPDAPDDVPILAAAVAATSTESENANVSPNSNAPQQAKAPLSIAEIQARAELEAAQKRAASSAASAASTKPVALSDGEITAEENEARRARVLKVERGARPLTTAQLEVSSGQNLGNGVTGIVTSGRDLAGCDLAARQAKTRVRVEQGRGSQRLLSQPLLLGLTAFTSAALMFLILNLRTPQKNAPLLANAPLRIDYSNELQSVMDEAAQKFAQTSAGRGLALDLRATEAPTLVQIADAKIADAKIAAFDAWIPTETLWSERFNRAAAKNGQPTIGAIRPLALSPLVLIARDDYASSLKRRFPNGIITSWDALRGAIASDAPHHFGLSDPQKSGAGALARWFMAREWSLHNNVDWNRKAVGDARLWKWMRGFEENVSDNMASTSDMTQDLVLGNSDRFWWTIAYESDAVRWLKLNKPIRVFYLPQTAFAQHPFCTVDRATSSTRNRRTRKAFEAFMRSRSMQIALAQNGFRPTEIRLADVPGNPFARPAWRARGLRENGFRIDQRINLELLESLIEAWKARY